ncbi:LacI family DNA-binding transcriptional regulator [Agriterribacter sp.]|uniref:LacI family DNA-binding transcriptional regulator n=1 Tax=Agriterribacter sp. TaxID=2821509 RepID=UPI002C57A1D7|nr:LacI family DNA-binding transcriptional regulator [Agriterribacter sp.]HRO47162.1 LacI family DNA-binding transcriptional regulator [Agriterribacter sp.]HRQ17888.1 LacI family DNA-binding transcriptional regulator [Agriterribacter sp.]
MTPRKVTIIDIAKRLNISKSTVSRALSDHHSIGLRTKMRVQQLASELNYEPDNRAIFFKQRKTYLIGLILPSFSNGFFASIVSGVEDVAYQKKYTLLLGQSRDDQEREKNIVEAMKDHRVDGMLISISKNTLSYEHFKLLEKNNIPIVFIDRIPEMQDIHFIASKLESGMIEAVNFLVKKGHSVIGLINGPEKFSASKERHIAYVKALTENRIKYNKELIVYSDLAMEGNIEASKKLLSLVRRPTAIITFNDYVALDVIHYCKQQKIKINKDISFVSFANEAICNYMDHPPLASVEQFPYQQGQKATEMLIEIIEKTKSENGNKKELNNLLLPSQLIVRNNL